MGESRNVTHCIWLTLFRFLLFVSKIYSAKSDFLLIFVYVIVDFKICKTFYHLLIIYKQSLEKDRIYVYSFNLKSELRETFSPIFFLCAILWCIFLILQKNVLDEILMMILIFIPVAIECWISYPEKNDVLGANNLNIGYGAALAYYKNYLELNMPYNFNDRIENFKSYHKVDLQKKLFILVPKSCRIPRYLESEDENIERCQELPEEEITHAGIKNRVYNITVYLIRTNMNSKGLRMAVEYAQPLKALFALKEKRLITEIEMFYERKLFAANLKAFLIRNNDMYKFCEIIEYDDDNGRKVSEVLVQNHHLHYETV